MATFELPLSKPEDVGFDSAALKRISAWQENLVKDEKLPFTQVLIARHGKPIYFNCTGYQNVETKTPISPDTISRIYSMSKPITSVALMMLYEHGLFQLSDPVHKYLGEKWKKKNMRVHVEGDAKNGYKTEPCKKTITVEMVLTHTSGLSYGFDMIGAANKVDEIYYKEGLFAHKDGHDMRPLSSFVDKLAELPLVFQPGSAWNYGYNVEVVGRLVEVISGMSIDEYLAEKIFKPLKMVDTSFVVPESKAGRFASYYMRKGANKGMIVATPGKGPTSGLHPMKNPGKKWQEGSLFFEPGGGLVGTIGDYFRFTQMLLNGGELDGARILSRKTIDWMTVNHLHEDQDMKAMLENGGYGEVAMEGHGFGAACRLGFSVVVDPAKTALINSVGSYAWGGAASTIFWNDPAEDITVLFFTQFMFRDDFLLPLRATLGNLVYGSLIGDNDPLRLKMRPWSTRSKL